MNRLDCMAMSCTEPVMAKCENCKVYLCRSHLEFHQVEYVSHEISSKNFDQVEEVQYRLVSVFGHPHAIYFHKTMCPLPRDYLDALTAMSNQFYDAVTVVPKGKDENIKEICVKIAAAIKNIIYNLDINPTELFNNIHENFLAYHSKIETITSYALVKLIEEAEIALEMPKIATKAVFFKVNLEDQKQLFIQKYFLQNEITIKDLPTEFFSFFKPFLRENPKDIKKLFDNFEIYYRNEKVKACNEFRKKMDDHLKNLWISIRFCRVAIFSYKMRESMEMIEISNNSAIIACLFLKESQFEITSVAELSNSEVLLSCLLENETYFVYCSNMESHLVLITKSENCLIASGSTCENVIVVHGCPRRIAMYTLKDLKLVEIQQYNFGLETMEKINDIVYVKELKKVLFSTNIHPISSFVLNGNLRVKIPIDLQDQDCKGLAYYRSKQLICLKTVSSIHLFSIYMQKVQNFEVSEGAFACINNHEEELVFILQHPGGFCKLKIELANVFKSAEHLNDNLNFQHCERTLPSSCQVSFAQDIFYPFYIRRFSVPELSLNLQFIRYQ